MANILAIESSCDETAAAVVTDGRTIRSNIIASQISIHEVYGGVVPEIASRQHLQAIDLCIREALAEADMTLKDLDAVAVTYGPGLVGALLVGVAEAKALAYAAGLPLIAVNHIRGHIAANYITNPDWKPPFLCLVVSGGHTHLVLVHDYTDFEILGKTHDDAAGEAYDKVARAIGLGYPGGPKIDQLSKEGRPDAVHYPRPCLDEEGYSFSFSGLKSAVLNDLNQRQMKRDAHHDKSPDIPEVSRADIAASFQQAVVDVLVGKTMQAAKVYGISRIAMAGGVSANSALRAGMRAACDRRGYTLNVPDPKLCTDNAAMIGCAAYHQYLERDFADLSLNAVPGAGLQ